MKQANTVAVDAQLDLKVREREALALAMAVSREVAEARMPEMVALCHEINALKCSRDDIIRRTFYR